MTFETFYSAYPRKVGRGAAEKAFNKLKPDAELVKTMVLAIQAQSIYRKEAQKAGAFVPDWCHASTWLNGQRWLDEIPSHEKLKSEVMAQHKVCSCGQRATQKGKDGLICVDCWYKENKDEERILYYTSRLKAEWRELNLQKTTTWQAACVPVIKAKFRQIGG